MIPEIISHPNWKLYIFMKLVHLSCTTISHERFWVECNFNTRQHVSMSMFVQITKIHGWLLPVASRSDTDSGKATSNTSFHNPFPSSSNRVRISLSYLIARITSWSFPAWNKNIIFTPENRYGMDIAFQMYFLRCR